MFYQVVTIDFCNHVPGPVSHSSVESEYNVSCNAGMALSRFRMKNHELINKDPDVIPEQVPIIILDKNHIFVCPILVRTSNKPDTFPDKRVL